MRLTYNNYERERRRYLNLLLLSSSVFPSLSSSLLTSFISIRRWNRFHATLILILCFFSTSYCNSFSIPSYSTNIQQHRLIRNDCHHRHPRQHNDYNDKKCVLTDDTASDTMDENYAEERKQQQPQQEQAEYSPKSLESSYPLSSPSMLASSSLLNVDDTAAAIANMNDSSNNNYAGNAHSVHDINNYNIKNHERTRVTEWHRERRKSMMMKYGDQILPLEKSPKNGTLGKCLLLLSNLSLLGLSILSSHLPPTKVVALAVFPGSIFSLWQLQILHDVIHGSLLKKKEKSQERKQSLLFWGSMPSYFGYYLYLKYGHLTHHTNLGNENLSLQQLFQSKSSGFEDGDVLFVAHRMKIKGPSGPTFFNRTLSISKGVFDHLWRMKSKRNHNNVDSNKRVSSFILRRMIPPRYMWNMLMFSYSFLFERIMLGMNDIVVAMAGYNYFFPNKPRQFHQETSLYCRVAVATRLLLWYLSGSWKSLLFLYLSETLWSIPPHPACAMFISNHGSKSSPLTTKSDSIMNKKQEQCIPTSSTYAGTWYSLLTLGTNYHCEHHDFPTIPFHKLHLLRNQICPEYYDGAHKDANGNKKDNIWNIMKQAFESPDFYACMDAGSLYSTTPTTNIIF